MSHEGARGSQDRWNTEVLLGDALVSCSATLAPGSNLASHVHATFLCQNLWFWGHNNFRCIFWVGILESLGGGDLLKKNLLWFLRVVHMIREWYSNHQESVHQVNNIRLSLRETKSAHLGQNDVHDADWLKAQYATSLASYAAWE